MYKTIQDKKKRKLSLISTIKSAAITVTATITITANITFYGGLLKVRRGRWRRTQSDVAAQSVRESKNKANNNIIQIRAIKLESERITKTARIIVETTKRKRGRVGGVVGKHS